jgi:hypothetical protein
MVESSTSQLEAPRREAFRQELVARLPRWYSPWVHLGLTSFIGLGLIAVAVFLIRDLAPLELLLVPIVFLASNAFEWRAHRDLLHKRMKGLGLELFFVRHTIEHHAVFVREDMAIRSAREFQLVLIPFYGIVGVFVLTLPVSIGLELAGQRNLAALFVITTMGYVISYEWLHLSYHLAPDGFIGRRWIIGKLRQHHATHHAPELMQQWNFNVTIPIWDWVRGTIHRDAPPVQRAR